MDPEGPSEPAQIGPYRLHEVLGEGGMGTVYRAVQTEPVRREVALKIIKPGMDSKEVVARFESERQALALMDHSGIARVLDAGSAPSGRPYFVMELVRGVPVDEYCDTHRLSVEERIELFIHVCEAVHHAHQKGVIHRDLKPSNVLVTLDGERPAPKVIDFGIAKAVGSALTGSTLVTTLGQMLGTPAYMSPEQAERSGLDVDTRTDVYSLGVMLYELLSGALPFDPDTLRRPDFVVQFLLRDKDVDTPSSRLAELDDTQKTVARNRRTDVRSLRRELRGDLDWIVMKAMEKDRTRRYGAASELASDLRRYLENEPVTARPPSTAYRLSKFARRNKGPLAAAAALLLALSGGATAATVGFVRADRSAALARQSAERAEAVSAFLDDMLRASDPVGGGGPETTVREVLDAAGAEVADGALAGRPAVEVAVRRSIGGTYLQLGLYPEAEEHLGAALTLAGSAPDVAARDQVVVLDLMGQLRRRQDDAKGAVDHYRRALAVADSAGLAEDAGSGATLVNGVRSDLGLALRDLDRIDEAADILEALAESRRRLLAPDDLDLATTLNNLASVKRRQGDIDGSIRLFEETAEVLRRAVGEQHPYVAAVMESIASLNQTLGHYEIADSLLGAALAMRREILGARHPDVVVGLNNLGLLRVEMDDAEGARRILDEALALSRDVLGDDHTRTATTLNNLGLLHLRLGEAGDAMEAFREAARIREARLGPDHRNTLNARANLAAALLLGGDAPAAEALAGRTVADERAMGLDDATLFGAALRTWGRALTELRRLDQAEAPLLEAWELQAAALGEDHAQTRATADALVALYEAWERPGEVDVWRSRGRTGG